MILFKEPNESRKIHHQSNIWHSSKLKKKKKKKKIQHKFNKLVTK